MFGRKDRMNALQREVALLKKDVQKLHTVALAKLASAEIEMAKKHFGRKQQKNAMPEKHSSHGRLLYKMGLAVCIGYLLSAFFRDA